MTTPEHHSRPIDSRRIVREVDIGSTGEVAVERGRARPGGCGVGCRTQRVAKREAVGFIPAVGAKERPFLHRQQEPGQAVACARAL